MIKAPGPPSSRRMPPSLIVTHCGSGSGPDLTDGAERAGHAALAILVRGGGAGVARGEGALAGAPAAPATRGPAPPPTAAPASRPRLDGRAQMDASIMTDDLEA